MREYGQLQSSFYMHPDIQALSDGCKLFAIYLLTGPHSNGLGCYRLPDGYIVADLGWSFEVIAGAFAELAAIRFAYRCERTQSVFIPKFLHWNPIANGNVARAREREFDAVPKQCEHYRALAQAMLTHGEYWHCPFAQRLAAIVDGDPSRNPLGNRLGNPLGNRFERPETTVSKGPKQPFRKGMANKIRSDPTLPDPTQPLRPTDACSVTSKAGSEPAAAVTSVHIPTKRRGEEYRIAPAKIGEWQATYPDLDVRQRLRAIRQWSIDNPEKRKTRRGMLRFVNAWLARDHERGPSDGASGAGGAKSRSEQRWEEFYDANGGPGYELDG